MAAPTAAASSTPPVPAVNPLPPAPGQTPGTNFELDNLPLAAGDGVSIGLHPSPVPITLRPTASMPLTVCPHLNPSSGGTGLSWPNHILSRCWHLPQNLWVQLPSTRTGSFHIAFRVTAGRAGTISSLTVSYQRVDTFLTVITKPTTHTAMTVGFTPTGRSAAATVYAMPAGGPVANGQVSLYQAGLSTRQTGACTFPTEAEVCFLGLTAGRPVTVRVPRASGTATIGLDLSWP